MARPTMAPLTAETIRKPVWGWYSVDAKLNSRHQITNPPWRRRPLKALSLYQLHSFDLEVPKRTRRMKSIHQGTIQYGPQDRPPKVYAPAAPDASGWRWSNWPWHWRRKPPQTTTTTSSGKARLPTVAEQKKDWGKSAKKALQDPTRCRAPRELLPSERVVLEEEVDQKLLDEFTSTLKWNAQRHHHTAEKNLPVFLAKLVSLT